MTKEWTLKKSIKEEEVAEVMVWILTTSFKCFSAKVVAEEVLVSIFNEFAEPIFPIKN